MNINNVPLFSPSKNENETCDDRERRIISEWQNYSIPFEQKGIDNIHLFKHNIENIEPHASAEIISYWTSIATEIFIMQIPTNFLGAALNTLFSKSDRSESVISVIKSGLAFCQTVDQIDFICQNLNNNLVLDYFYNIPEYKTKLLRVSHHDLAKNEQVLYMARYIYTPHFLNDLVNIIDEYGQSIHKSLRLTTLRIAAEINVFMDDLASSSEQRFTHIVSMLYVANTLKSLGFIENRFDSINTLFETEFPVQYKNYKTLINLGVVPSPAEFIPQLTLESTPSFNLPELN